MKKPNERHILPSLERVRALRRLYPCVYHSPLLCAHNPSPSPWSSRSCLDCIYNETLWKLFPFRPEYQRSTVDSALLPPVPSQCPLPAHLHHRSACSVLKNESHFVKKIL